MLELASSATPVRTPSQLVLSSARAAHATSALLTCTRAHLAALALSATSCFERASASGDPTNIASRKSTSPERI